MKSTARRRAVKTPPGHSAARRKAPLLDQCALFDLHRASRVLTTMYNAHLRETNMTMAQFTLLRNIAALSPANVTQIAEAMLMDRTSVTRLIEPLITSGYAKSEPSEDDKRVRWISVTDAGTKALSGSFEAWQAAQQELFDIIGPEQWMAMRRALRDTVHMVRKQQGEVAGVAP